LKVIGRPSRWYRSCGSFGFVKTDLVRVDGFNDASNNRNQQKRLEKCEKEGRKRQQAQTRKETDFVQTN
jgi:hypothetical protein